MLREWSPLGVYCSSVILKFSFFTFAFVFVGEIQWDKQAWIRGLEPPLLNGPNLHPHPQLPGVGSQGCLFPKPCPVTTATLHLSGCRIGDLEGCGGHMLPASKVMKWGPEDLWVAVLTLQIYWSQRDHSDNK